MSEPAAALAVEEVVAGYGGVLALQGVSISVRPATITAVLRANGAGKTTLLRTISGFVRPRGGRVVVDGRDLTGRRPEDMAPGGGCGGAGAGGGPRASRAPAGGAPLGGGAGGGGRTPRGGSPGGWPPPRRGPC